MIGRGFSSIKTYLPGWFWFLLGIILAVGLTKVADSIYTDIVDRGPEIVRLEWGRSIHAYDSFYGWTNRLLMIAVVSVAMIAHSPMEDLLTRTRTCHAQIKRTHEQFVSQLSPAPRRA